MKFVWKSLELLPFGLLVAICGCGGGTTLGLSMANSLKVSLSPQPKSIPVNGTIEYTAAISGSGSGIAQPTWSLTSGNGGINVGTLSSSFGTTVTFTAPPAPPVYVGLQPIDPSFQGIVSLGVSAQAVYGSAGATTNIIITAPSVTTGISPTTASVALGATMYFAGYAVGNVNNAVTFQVNGITGGSSSLGTITNTPGSQGYYTAPSVMPIGGDTVTITLVSQADPSKISSAIITLH